MHAGTVQLALFAELTGPGPAQDAVDTVTAHVGKGTRRPNDTIWRANPREQGLIGLTDAVGWFGARGWSVSLPLIDSQSYDLIVDDGSELRRVQVKTTTALSRSGSYYVTICTNGGNQSYHTRKPFDAGSCDLLYVLTDGGSRYLIPSTEITARTALTLGRRMERYRV
jgi:hypothetical protein